MGWGRVIRPAGEVFGEVLGVVLVERWEPGRGLSTEPAGETVVRDRAFLPGGEEELVPPPKEGRRPVRPVGEGREGRWGEGEGVEEVGRGKEERGGGLTTVETGAAVEPAAAAASPTFIWLSTFTWLAFIAEPKAARSVSEGAISEREGEERDPSRDPTDWTRASRVSEGERKGGKEEGEDIGEVGGGGLGRGQDSC